MLRNLADLLPTPTRLFPGVEGNRSIDELLGETITILAAATLQKAQGDMIIFHAADSNGDEFTTATYATAIVEKLKLAIEGELLPAKAKIIRTKSKASNHHYFDIA